MSVSNLEPLRAFQNTITLQQTGTFGNVGDNDCCWVNDARNCDQYRATIDYSKAVYPNDLRDLRNLSMRQLYNNGYIQSVQSQLKLTFTICGGTCGIQTQVRYQLTYVDDQSTPESSCFTSRSYTGAVREVNSCTINNNIKPIKSFYVHTEAIAGCDSYGVKDVSYEFSTSITINMKNYCRNGNNFISPVCIQFCSYDESSTDCYNIALDKCFTDDKILNKEGHCYRFLSSYAGRQDTSIVALDLKLKDFCNQKSINPENYIGSTGVNQVYTDLCACHFDDQIYTNYYASLIEQIPNLSISGQGSRKCVFPYCNVSPFKSGDMKGTGTCPTIQCLQSISLLNNGTINGDINAQTNANCTSQISSSSLNNPSSQPPGPPPVSFLCTKDSDCTNGKKCNTTTGICQTPTPSDNSWVNWLIGIGLGLLFVIALILIIYFFTSKPKPRAQNLGINGYNIGNIPNIPGYSRF
jgi:hypothetical protein